MDDYKTGHINLPPQPAGADLHRSGSDTRSFGESHAAELSSINSDHSGATAGIPTTPPAVEYKPPSQPTVEYKPPSQPPASFKASEPQATDKLPSTPINVADLNQSPTLIPPTPSLQSVPVVATEGKPVDSVPTNIPTVAETGIPVSAGSEGPGPASGSLRDLRESTSTQQPEVPVQPKQSPPGPSPLESAGDEKKRLEREERERLLNSESGQGDAKKDGGEDLPPQYQDI